MFAEHTEEFLKKSELYSSDNRPIPHQIFEISRLSIGILTPKKLDPGLFLTLLFSKREIPLRIVSAEYPNTEDGVCRYIAGVTDFNINLEEIFRELIPRLVKSQDNLRYGRFMTAPHLEGKMKTFGSGNLVHSFSVNVSKSGLLLIPKRKAPFRKGTLLEITLSGFEAILPEVQEVFECEGTIMREASIQIQEGETRGFGINLASLSDSNQTVWLDYLRQLEETLLQENALGILNERKVEG